MLFRNLTSVATQRGAILDKIFVIDNASTDGTEDYLINNGMLKMAEQNFIYGIKVEYIRLSTNLGGAGGFNKGLKLAYSQGYDYYWLMDDDGYASNTCLDNLLRYAVNYDFIGPLVLNELDHKKLSFEVDGIENIIDIDKKYRNCDVIENLVYPFNGVLFSKTMLDKIGFPMADMFIWGDEIEYTLRVMHAGIKVVTVKKAIYFHPKDRVKFKLLFNRFRVPLPDDIFRRYCLFRNYTYIVKKYYKKLNMIKWFIKYLYIFTISIDIRGLVLFLKASRHGLKNDFSHHKEYLK